MKTLSATRRPACGRLGRARNPRGHAPMIWAPQRNTDQGQLVAGLYELAAGCRASARR
jgi:hypothetical protein